MESCDYISIKLEKLFFIENSGALCRLPYPGHKKGCPNFGKSPNCPPQAPKLRDKYNLEKDYYFIIQPFNLAAHKAKMKTLHPEWSDKQCACVLYWQNGVKKELRIASLNLIDKLAMSDLFDYKSTNNFDYDLIPEAMGLDVFKTALAHGIPIERNPQHIIYKISFIGALK